MVIRRGIGSDHDEGERSIFIPAPGSFSNQSLKLKQAMNTGKKILIFVPHALERMKERSIDKEEVIAALSYPEDIDCRDEKRKIAQRFIEGKLLRVVYEEEEDTIIVVSVYRTSKYNKYIRRY